jgi:glucose/mannose transport system permease protein
MPLFVMLTTRSRPWTTSAAAIWWRRVNQLRRVGKAWGTACTGVFCGGLWGNFMNSVNFVVPAVIISTLVGAFSGYVLTMWFKGSDVLFALLLISFFIPFQGCCCRWRRLGLAGHRQLHSRPDLRTWSMGWLSPRCSSAIST